ncbi:MAG: histone deacetylase family protein [Desulfotomaculales bacterium]
MKVVFHERYKEVYAADPAAAYGRMDCILREVEGKFDFLEPAPAGEEDLLLVHLPGHVEAIKRRGLLYEVALLAVGGALLSAELALQGEAAFGLLRPPGHHASPGHSWGFCWFNNVAVAVEKYRREGKIKKAVVVDFDLHFGDGTANIFAGVPDVVYHHAEGSTRTAYLDNLRRFLETHRDCDLVAVSAGFDRHVRDWGGLLTTEDYRTIGGLLREYARDVCGGRIFSVLEGGYNHDVLGLNVRAYLEGLAG